MSARQWDYTFVFHDAITEATLRKLGEDGWELVTALESTIDAKRQALLYFKRPRARVADAKPISSEDFARIWGTRPLDFEEREPAGSIAKRFLIVFNGKKFFVRSVRCVQHDLELDEKVYRCAYPIGIAFDTIEDAWEAARVWTAT